LETFPERIACISTALIAVNQDMYMYNATSLSANFGSIPFSLVKTPDFRPKNSTRLEN
jgi:hypothetical protein